MSNIKGSKSARNFKTWLEKGYSEADAKFESRKRMPGTFEYYRYFKNIQSDEEAKKLADEWNKNRAVTLSNLIKKYGAVDVKHRWEQYCKKQAETNTFEYKKRKYGWTKDQFNEYNQSRATTEKNFIIRHGNDEGKRRWKEYCDLQSYVGSSEQYFIDLLGEEVGKEKWKHISFLKLHSYESYLEQFSGNVELATKKYQEWCIIKAKSSTSSTSKVSQDLFNKIRDSLNLKEHIIFYQIHNQEWCLLDNTRVVYLDFFDKTTGRVIEFNGDFWHANPKIYTAESKINIPGSNSKIAKDIWEFDKTRLEFVRKFPYITDILIIWEQEYREDENKTIQKCIQFLTK